MARPSLPFLYVATAALAGAIAAAFAASALTACEDAESYVYSAQKYDPVADCLAAYTPVEVVNGPGASSTCPAMCLTVGEDLYVSAMCPPLPVIATAVPADAGACIAALTAAERGGTCDTPPDAEAPDEDASSDDGGPESDAEVTDAETPDAADSAAPIVDASDAG